MTDEIYMQRCLQLAANGMQNAKPNPMVGAVIVCDGRIIGEGYHVCCGQAHAEVNAFMSVKPDDEHLLPYSTLYVSLEPCSHYGKTPPCADLIVSKGVRRVVVGCLDPFEKVSGRGIQRLRDAGIDVTVGVLEEECRHLNRRFFTFHTKHRPYITLKWAQSSNGFIDNDGKAFRFSTPYTQMLVHKLRSENDAILVGRITEEREHPQLNVREWTGKSPRKIVLSHDNPLDLARLYDEGIQTLLVEGGRETLQWFIDNGLYDDVRIETSPIEIEKGTPAPTL
ncbi:MAG: bifunctional diaminohydroxyphosphoribosylaminopyrimidine deaminase/5-amino-6-(5-phosphoribosylamino)uracil reductase RibD [Bacteroidaceae bacterium]|nr:bifunctional diaminohydroxyphosphoribosylaminopyrimidine deaminase/5-amino-6-(5-phosphoribosylamino)uracil reductase RibD [Bacteroidaceae bacterium]